MKKIFFLPGFTFLLIFLCSCGSTNTAKTQSEAGTVSQLKKIFINGDSLHYIDIGRGTPVVFVHGAVGDYRTFETQMDEFSKNHRVISYSRRFAYPNQQSITDSSKLSVVSHSSDLAELLKALNLGPVHLFGHSYGADIALITAIDHPELVSKLILGEPFIPSLMQKVPGGDTILNSFMAKAFGPVVMAFKNNNDEEAVKALINGVMGDSLYYNNLSQKKRDAMMDNIIEMKGALSTHDNFPGVGCDDVKKIKAPVLLVKGDKSPAVFIMMTEELKKCITNSEIVTLPNTTHGLEYENPVDFNKAVLAFIDKH